MEVESLWREPKQVIVSHLLVWWHFLCNVITVGQVFNRSTMCGAFRKAGILKPDWDKIGNALNFNQQLTVSADIFFESWHACAHDCQPSWDQLACAVAGTVKYKQTTACIQAKEGMN